MWRHVAAAVLRRALVVVIFFETFIAVVLAVKMSDALGSACPQERSRVSTTAAFAAVFEFAAFWSERDDREPLAYFAVLGVLFLTLAAPTGVETCTDEARRWAGYFTIYFFAADGANRAIFR